MDVSLNRSHCSLAGGAKGKMTWERAEQSMAMAGEEPRAGEAAGRDGEAGGWRRAVAAVRAGTQ